MRLRDLHAEWRESPAFLLGAYFFEIVKGEQPLTRCGESGVQKKKSHLTKRKNQPRATSARDSNIPF